MVVIVLTRVPAGSNLMRKLLGFILGYTEGPCRDAQLSQGSGSRWSLTTEEAKAELVKKEEW